MLPPCCLPAQSGLQSQIIRRPVQVDLSQLSVGANTKLAEQAQSGLDTDVSQQGLFTGCDHGAGHRQFSRMRVSDYFSDPKSMTREELIVSIERFQRNVRENPLTGLPVRGLWFAREAEGLIGKYKANIDVDFLKWINDVFGRAQGDEFLGWVGEALCAVKINAYHISGDEFYAHHDNLNYLRTQLEIAHHHLKSAEFGNAHWSVKGCQTACNTYQIRGGNSAQKFPP